MHINIFCIAQLVSARFQWRPRCESQQQKIISLLCICLSFPQGMPERLAGLVGGACGRTVLRREKKRPLRSRRRRSLRNRKHRPWRRPAGLAHSSLGRLRWQKRRLVPLEVRRERHDERGKLASLLECSTRVHRSLVAVLASTACQCLGAVLRRDGPIPG